MSGPRWCCCPDCVVFEDHFDRCSSPEECPPEGFPEDFPCCPPLDTGYFAFPVGPDGPIATQKHRPVWDPQSGDWWWYVSPVPQYPGDGAIYEISGTGEIWCLAGWDEESVRGDTQGFGVECHTVAELPMSVYRLLFLLDTDTGDCIIIEFCNGDGDAWPIVPGWFKCYKRTGGVETEIKSLVAAAGLPLEDPWLGRYIWAKWIPDHGLCANVDFLGISIMNEPPAMCIPADELGGVPSGRKAGIANNSGSSIPIAVDNFATYRMMYVDKDNETVGCFDCMCLCRGIPDEKAYLFPLVIHGIIEGQCWHACPGPLCGQPCDDPYVVVEFDLYRDEPCSLAWRSKEDIYLCDVLTDIWTFCTVGESTLGLCISSGI